jgi:type I restriction enzyme S subunit
MTDWPVKTLGDVCEVIAGQSPEGQFYNQDGKGTPFYQGKKDFTARFLGSPTTWTTEVTKLARPGDILMSVRAPVGPVNLCPIEACIGRGLAVIRPSSKTDTDFIFYYLESIQSEIAGTEGAVFASINKAQIAELSCPVPPLEEQKRIAALLDEATARITELTTCYEQARARVNDLFSSALRGAFASNPDWPVKTLGDVCDLVGGGTPSKDRPEFYGGDIPWATVRDLNVEILRSTEHSITAEALKSSSSNVIPAGSVVIATRVGLGKAVIVAQNTAINQDLRGLVVKNQSEVLSDYLFRWYLSMAHLVVAAGTGATVQGVKLPFVSGLEIPLPPLDEQRRIVELLDSMRAKTSEMVAAYDTKLTAAKNLCQSILEAAFRGEL